MEVSEVCRFLNQTPPFSYLNQQAIARLAQQISVYYFQAKQTVVQSKPHLMIVRTGVFALHNAEQQLLGKLQEGDFWGQESLLDEAPDTKALVCEEDGLVYWLDAEAFHRIINTYPRVAEFFRALAGRQLHRYQEAPPSFHLTLRVDEVIGSRKIVIAPDQKIPEAARLMTEKRVSTLLVEAEGELIGLVTDRDLRSRVLAQGLTLDTPIGDIMTCTPRTIQRCAFLYEAIQTMSLHNIHHLPVLDGEQLYGMLSITDIIRVQQDHPVYLIGNIHKQVDLVGLKQCCEGILPLLMLLGKQHLPAHEIGHIITSITDALTKHLIKLAVQAQGEPPCEFCWLAFGSQARMDQGIHSDQDNALILGAEPTGEVENYFARLADFVCQGLAECGVRLCPGNTMASNPALRLSLSSWLHKIETIIRNPTPDSVLQSSIYFDLRAVDGKHAFAQQLQQRMLKLAANNTVFQYHLAAGAIQHRAPLGLFKGFVLQQEGDQQPGCDLKKNGLALITDIARVYALALEMPAVSTRARLQKLAESGSMDKSRAQNLLDAFDLIAELRWQKHQQDVHTRNPVSNLLDPTSLHNLQRHQLKDSFNAINEAQAMVKFRFCQGL